MIRSEKGFSQEAVLRPFQPKKPMSYPHLPSCRASILCAAASLAVISAPASAAVKTWDGGGSDDNWQTAPNWDADTAPLPDDQLVFAGTLRLSPVNNFTAGTLFNGISFAADAGAFSLSGNGVTLTPGIAAPANNGTVTGGAIANNSPETQTLAFPLHLASGKHVVSSPSGGGAISLSGTFTRSANSTAVFAPTGGNITVTGTGLANNAAGILGGWAVLGNDWASLDGSGNLVPFAAYTDIATGAITSDPAANYRYVGNTDNITAADGTAIHTLATENQANAQRDLTVAGTLTFGAKGGIYRLGTSNNTGVFRVVGGNLTVAGGGELNLWTATNGIANFAATNNSLRIDSAITDFISAPGPPEETVPVTVNITGYADIRGANTYSGGTFINQGRVQTGSNASFGTGPVTVYPGGQAFVNQSQTWTNNFAVSGYGPTESNGGMSGPGALRLGSTSNIAGTITLTGNSRFTTSSTGGPTMSGRITGTGALEIASYGSANTLILNLANLGTPNDWNGPLTVNSVVNSRRTTVRLGADEQIPDASDVTIASANISPAVPLTTLDLRGFNETIGGLNSAVSPIMLAVGNLASGTTSTLTLGANNASGDYGGALQDVVGSTLNVVKTGSGKQVLRGRTEYFGTTAVNAGTLEVRGDFLASGDVTVAAGARLQSSGTILAGNVTVAGGGTFEATHADDGLALLNGNLNLEAGSALDINTAALPANPITVDGIINPTGAAGTVTVNLTGPAPAVGEHPLISYFPLGSLGGTGVSAFTLGTVPPRFSGSIKNDPVLGAIVLDVDAVVTPKWTGAITLGNPGHNEWSTATLALPKNWDESPSVPTDFLSGDAVIFDDTALSTAPDISVADVTIGKATFSNETKDYVLTGSKGMAGVGEVVKEGAGKLTVSNPNLYSGGTTFTAGTLEITDGGSLGTGAVAINGTLFAFNRTDTSVFPNAITSDPASTAELHHTGSGSTTLGGNSSYIGATRVLAGTLRPGNSNAFGTLLDPDPLDSTEIGPVQVLSGGAVDFNGGAATNALTMTAKPFFIAGNGPDGAGALVNTGANGQLNALGRLTLEANASVGGTARLDLRHGGPVLDLAGFTLRKRGTNQFTVVAGTVVNGGSIIVEEGTLAMETTTITDGAGTITYEPGSNAQFYQNALTETEPGVFAGVSWPMTVRENVALGNAGAAVTAQVLSPITLEGNAVLVAFNSGTRAPNDAGKHLLLHGNITESGGSYGLDKQGVNTVTLAGAANTYTGATTVSGGILVVDGAVTASPVAVAAGATLGGAGTVGGSVAGDGSISPGIAAIGTFTTGATTFSATGSLDVQIDSFNLEADKLAVTGNLALGGSVLNVTDLGGTPLAADTKFTVASYTGSISGSFANAPDGGTLIVGLNTFAVDYDELVSGQTSITLTALPGSAYDTWATEQGLDGTNNGKMDDPDSDGLENVIEFGLNQNPLAAGDGGKVRAVLADVDPGAPVVTAYTLTVPMRDGTDFTGSGTGDLLSLPLDGVVYRVEGSATLSDFPLDITEVTPALSGGMEQPDTGWSYRSFRLPGTPGAPHAKAFLRVDVSEAP